MTTKPIDKQKLFIALALLVIAVAAAFGLIFSSRDGGGEGDKVGPALEEKKPVENACASGTTLDGLKRLVFDQAGRLRTLERVDFDILAGGAVVRMEQPVLREHDERLDLTRCSGRFILELPPGAEAAFDGEHRLVADTVYEIQAAADGSGPVYRMTGAETIVSRLAAFDMEGRRLEAPVAVDVGPLIDANENGAEILPPGAEPAPPGAETQPTSNPSFDCRFARSQSEMLICGSERLAAQDRSMAALYDAAMRDAGQRARNKLVRTGDAFLAYRDRCADAACVAQAYDGRMREIRDIMADEQ